jgi:hypothetical protein
VKFISDNAWVWAGTGLVLITLSGRTRTLGLTISVAAVVIHLVSTLLTKDD